MKRPRRNHTAAYKAKVALAAAKGDKTLAELAEKFDVHASQIVQWNAQLLDGATGVFLTATEKRESQGPSVKDMQAKIGQLALENDLLAGALGRIDGASAKKGSTPRTNSRCATGIGITESPKDPRTNGIKTLSPSYTSSWFR